MARLRHGRPQGLRRVRRLSPVGRAPFYRIEKRPALQARQGQWAIIGEGGQILKRGRDLAQVLRVFDGRKFQVID
jgi:hypothetical protein